MNKIKNDDDYAQRLYASLCNVTWIKDGSEDSWTWRAVGGNLAELRGKGESYMDFYCSGNEGNVSTDIEVDLGCLGWRPADSVVKEGSLFVWEKEDDC